MPTIGAEAFFSDNLNYIILKCFSEIFALDAKNELQTLALRP